ncbi:MAG: right-handed parallel beta-helix repeat-containing protein [Chloroflexia bacterium]|nr:right-handed parallel beta-helix repeat-containing protein [Chloroflexia bacterium]
MAYHLHPVPSVSRRRFLGLAGVTLTASAALAGSAWFRETRSIQAQSPSATYLDAGDFGLVGDGETDDAPALQAAIDAAAERRMRLVIPPGAYAVASSVNARTGSTISAYGVTLVTFIPDLGDPGTSFATVRIYDSNDVTIHGLEVEGRKDAFDHSQWKHGFGLNNSRNVWLYQCQAHRCKGDGVILENENIGDVNVDVLVESSNFGENYRMGGTASGALRARFLNCAFYGTSGTLPMCGFDVEPDRPDVTCQDISFFHCDFSDNGTIGADEGYGFNVSFQPGATGPQSGVYLENCTMMRNGAAGVDLYRVPKGVELSNCQVTDNAHEGIIVYADATDIVIRGGNVQANGRHGIRCAVEPDAPCENIVIDGVTIRDNGWAVSTLSNGIHLEHDVDDVTVTNCAISGSTGYGLFVGETVTNLETRDLDLANNLQGASYPVIGRDGRNG